MMDEMPAPTGPTGGEIVFGARKQTPVAIGAVFFGIAVLWGLQQSNGLTPTLAGIVTAVVALVVWVALMASRRRLAFSGATLKLLSGSKVIEQIDLRRVSRLVCRIVLRPKASHTTYLAVLPEGEIELFDKRAYRELPRILQMLEARTGRMFEEERKPS
jgi:hypothetical protein